MRSCRWNTGPRRRSAWSSGSPATRSAGRSCGAARSTRARAWHFFRSLGGEIVTGWRVESLDELPPAGRAPRRHAPPGHPDRRASAPGGLCPPAQTVPLRRGGFQARLGTERPDSLVGAGLCASGDRSPRRDHRGNRGVQAAVGRGGHPDRPFVLLAQPSLFDPTRAPAGQHTAWAYCHVPNGSTVNMTDRIEAQVERFAPGFRDLILAREHVMEPGDFETYNANYIGGDINGGTRTSASSSRPRWRASSPTRPPCPASISAPRQRRRAAAFTGCAATMPPARPAGLEWGGRSRPDPLRSFGH